MGERGKGITTEKDRERERDHAIPIKRAQEEHGNYNSSNGKSKHDNMNMVISRWAVSMNTQKYEDTHQTQINTHAYMKIHISN